MEKRGALWMTGAISVLVPAAASLYAALRTAAVIGHLLTRRGGSTVSEVYSGRLADVLGQILLLMAWLALTILLQARVASAKRAIDRLRVGCKVLGISILVVALTGVLVQVTSPTLARSTATLIVSILLWTSGTGITVFGFRSS